MKTAVDTNVLFDLLGGAPGAASAARQALLSVLSSGPVVICPVVYAELAAGFAHQDELTQFIQDLPLRVEDFSADALFQAAAAWKRYALRRGQQVQCPQCGRQAPISCPSCGAPLGWRQHIIADFLIGGHASCQADRLLTRDTGYYRTYFPTLLLVVPASLGFQADT